MSLWFVALVAFGALAALVAFGAFVALVAFGARVARGAFTYAVAPSPRNPHRAIRVCTINYILMARFVFHAFSRFELESACIASICCAVLGSSWRPTLCHASSSPFAFSLDYARLHG